MIMEHIVQNAENEIRFAISLSLVCKLALGYFVPLSKEQRLPLNGVFSHRASTQVKWISM